MNFLKKIIEAWNTPNQIEVIAGVGYIGQGGTLITDDKDRRIDALIVRLKKYETVEEESSRTGSPHYSLETIGNN